MGKRMPMDVNFGGRMQTIDGDVKLKSFWDALKKSFLTCFLCWLIGCAFMIIPIINITMPVIFWVFGPILASAVFLRDRRFISSIKALVDCPQCDNRFEIYEKDLSLPLYGACPQCRAGYQVHINSLETKPSSNPIKDPRDERYIPTSSAMTMKALQGRGSFFEEKLPFRETGENSLVT